MNNPFQEQLLKAGAVTKQQVQKANQEKNKKKKLQPKRAKKAAPVVDEAQIKAQKLAEEKALRDRELNKRKEDQARGKAVAAEINQLIKENMIKRDEKCELAYNFEHQNKVKRIYINKDQQQQIVSGKLGIARIDGMYELVPSPIAEKIKQRNEKRVVIFSDEKIEQDENDPYKDFEVPDDLMW